MRSVCTWLLLFIAAIALAGCGGGDSSNNQITQGSVALGVNWAARSRDVNSPSSAKSVVVTIVTGAQDGTNLVSSPLNRENRLDAYNATLTIPNVRSGQHNVQIRFFAEAGGTGTLVGSADTTINVTAATNTIGNVTTTNAITSVTITPNITIRVGTSQDLSVTARDSSNNIVALPSPTPVVYNITSGGSLARITNGLIEGVAAGTATVTATLDGIVSPATNVLIGPQITRLEQLENSALYGRVRLRLKGIGAATDTVSVLVGNTDSESETIAFTDANAPAESSTLGGAVDFLVPVVLAAGQQNLVVSINGVPSLALSVTVSNINPHAVFTLANGNKFVAELRRDKAPNTVDNFTGLVSGTKTWTPTYTALENGVAVQKPAGTAQNTPLYNGVTFHRVTNINAAAPDTKIVQAGDPITKQTNPPADWTAGTGNPGFLIPFETNDLLHEDGALAMARSQSRDSAGSQFYITDGVHSFLDGNYVVFGRVVEGLTNAKAVTQGTVLQTVVISGKLDNPAQ